MHISELAPELQELVHQRQIDQGNDGTYEGCVGDGKSCDNFNWDETPEGDEFWQLIYDGEDVTHFSCYPNKINNLFPIY
jgi:hypothetical protein